MASTTRMKGGHEETSNKMFLRTSFDTSNLPAIETKIVPMTTRPRVEKVLDSNFSLGSDGNSVT